MPVATRRPVGPGRQPEPLLEREDELDAVRAAITRARAGTGSLLVIEGEPGIGKSSLLEHARAVARESGVAVLAARGSELEGIHSFGVVGSLLGPRVREAPTMLQGPAAPAAAILAGVSPGGDASAPADRHAILHALYWVMINAAEQGPLLLAVDDAHWADAASLEFIVYLGRRVESMPVAVLVALRPAQASGTPLGEQVRSHRDATRLRLRPLSAEGIDTLIARTASPRLDSEHRQAIARETAGNPFYAVELLRSADRPPASTTGTVRSDGVPDAIQASIRRRLADEKGVARRVAEAVAVLGEEADLDRAARLAGSPTADAADAIRHMTERAILDARRLAFIHPIVRTAVMEMIPDTVRPQLHREAARVLAASGASAMVVAGHLLNTTPAADASVVELLREAADAAMAAGDAPAAARFLARALEEHAAAGDDARLLLLLARAEAAAGIPRAATRFDEALALLENAHDRAQARLAQAHSLIQATRWTDAMQAFDAGLAEVDPRDVELKSRLEAGYISSAYVGLTNLDEANRRLEHILSAPLHDPAHRELAAWSAFQRTLQLRGTAADARSLAQRAVADAKLQDLVHSGQVVEVAAGVLLSTGDLAEEIDLLTRAMEAAHGVNAYGKVGVYAYCRALPYYLTGRLQDAIVDGQTALAAHELGWEVFYPGTCAVLAWSHLERGDVDAADAAVQIDDEQWGQRLDFQFMTRIARGRVAAARGDLAGALAQLEMVRDAGAALGVVSTHVLADWRTWSAILLRAMGRRAESLRVAEEAAALAEGWDEPVAIARACWALGIARGGPTGIDDLRRSRAILEDGPARLELARVTLDLGAALRRAGSLAEARAVLMQAADLAHRHGALAILERARSELAAAGARPRRYTVTGVEALTPSELRVARLALEGRTNRAIAQALFVTPKAVEYHLANAYRKLNIRSRAELPDALAPTPEVASV